MANREWILHLGNSVYWAKWLTKLVVCVKHLSYQCKSSEFVWLTRRLAGCGLCLALQMCACFFFVSMVWITERRRELWTVKKDKRVGERKAHREEQETRPNMVPGDVLRIPSFYSNRQVWDTRSVFDLVKRLHAHRGLISPILSHSLSLSLSHTHRHTRTQDVV